MSAELPPARVVVDKRAPLLAAPPRRISPRLWIHVVFGSRALLGVLAWIVVAVYAEWIVFGRTGFESRHDFSAKTKGIVRAVAGSSGDDKEHPTEYRIDYEFGDQDHRRTSGHAYADEAPARGSEVAIEYDPAHPSASRLPHWGSRFRTTLQNAIACVLVLPGLAFLAVILVAVRRGLRLLRQGRETTGRLVDKTVRDIGDDGTITELTFEYTVDAKTYRHVVNANPQLEDEAAERLIYDVADPDRAVMLDSLPGGARVVDGKLRAHRVTPLLVVQLTCLAAALAAIGVYVYANLLA